MAAVAVLAASEETSAKPQPSPKASAMLLLGFRVSGQIQGVIMRAQVKQHR